MYANYCVDETLKSYANFTTMSSLVILFNRLISDKQLDTTFSSHMNCFTVEEVF